MRRDGHSQADEGDTVTGRRRHRDRMGVLVRWSDDLTTVYGGGYHPSTLMPFAYGERAPRAIAARPARHPE